MMDSFIRWWGRWDLNPHGINSQRILSPLRLPISPRPQRLEVPTGFEPVITELQSIALPLGYGTIFYEVMVGTVGLEPTRDFSQRILSPLRLPIPP